MFNSEELKSITSTEWGEGYFVSLYLNVDPLFNKRGDYMVHFKNMMKNTTETLDKAVYKMVRDDLEKIDNYIVVNKRMFKKGLAIFSSTENSFWKEYNLGVPVKNELIVDKTLYTQPLLNILDNYQRCAVLLVDKESARIFVVHLGDIIEYEEVHTPDIPGRHKKGGWYALSQSRYERHIDFHVGMHLKSVVEKLDSFFSEEYIGRLIIGGSDEAISTVKGLLHKTILNRVIGTVRMNMLAKADEVLSKIEPIVSEFEKKKEDEDVDILIAKAMKNENAVLGLDNVLNALQEQRVMKLAFVRDYKMSGYSCASCGFLTTQKVTPCPYCKGEMEDIDHMVNLAGEKAIQQGALIEIVSENKKLLDAGGIGAFLRF